MLVTLFSDLGIFDEMKEKGINYLLSFFSSLKKLSLRSQLGSYFFKITKNKVENT